MKGPIELFSEQDSVIVKVVLIIAYVSFLPAVLLWGIVALLLGD